PSRAAEERKARMQSPFKTKPSFAEVGNKPSLVNDIQRVASQAVGSGLSGNIPRADTIPLVSNIPLAGSLLGGGIELTTQLLDVLRSALATSPKLALDVLAAVISGINAETVAKMSPEYR